MICYRDKTFCPFHDTCLTGSSCVDALTREIEKDAIAWWGSSDAPICVWTEPPKCYKEKTE
jgi:hypothetical protein